MLNIYRITSIGHTHYGSVLPLAQTRTWDGQAKDLDWFVAKHERETGATVTSVEIVSTSTRCAGCGHSYRDHFEGKGTCDLGFCRSGCSEFVATS